MTKEEQFKKEIEEKVKKSIEEKENKGLIINDCTHDWGGCVSHYIEAIKKDLV